MQKINWKRGLKRVWLIAAIGWLWYAFVLFDVPSKVQYAWQYHTEYNSLLSEMRTADNVRICEYISGNTTESYLDLIAKQKTDKANIMRAKVIYDDCLNSTPSKPDYSWILPMILVPTLGVAIGVILIKIGFNLILWIWLGFKQ